MAKEVTCNEGYIKSASLSSGRQNGHQVTEQDWELKHGTVLLAACRAWATQNLILLAPNHASLPPSAPSTDQALEGSASRPDLSARPEQPRTQSLLLNILNTKHFCAYLNYKLFENRTVYLYAKFSCWKCMGHAHFRCFSLISPKPLRHSKQREESTCCTRNMP